MERHSPTCQLLELGRPIEPSPLHRGQSNGLGQWITRDEEAEVDIPLAPGKKFFRFSVKENE